jgi:hypothetical protein
MADCLALTHWNPLALGRCPRCSAVLILSQIRMRGRAMVACPNDYSIPRIKRLADKGLIKACGFMWYAPWTQPVR